MSEGNPGGSPYSVNLSRLQPFPSLTQLVTRQLAVWPEHGKYLGQRFNKDPMDFLKSTEDVSRMALLLIGDDPKRFCEDYKWMCHNFIEEELYFRRHKTYRLTTFADANRQVYANKAYMSRYVNGILLSQIFWHNHAAAFDLFRSQFLTGLPANFDHVDVGPGHGLFLALAAADPRCKTATGWDISPASLDMVGSTLAKFGKSAAVTLTLQDVVAPTSQHAQFDSAIISEVLEHLETPDRALQTLYAALRSGGHLFINVPINSPAPDHIYLWSEAEQIAHLVEAVGFRINKFHQLPMTGYSLDRAQAMRASISCVVFAQKP